MRFSPWLLIAAGLFAADAARAKDYSVSLSALETRDHDPIEGLEWFSTLPALLPIHVDLDSIERGSPLLIHIEGRFLPKDSSLILLKGDKTETTLVPAERSDRAFDLELPITGITTRFRLVAIDVEGEEERFEGEVSFKEWAEVETELTARRARAQAPSGGAGRRTRSVELGLGFSSTRFRQLLVADYDFASLNARASWIRPIIGPRIDAEVEGFFVLAPFSSSAGGQSLRLLDLAARAGYRFATASSLTRFRLAGGWGYSGMIVGGDAFGVPHLDGPQLQVEAERQLNEKHAAGAMIRWMGISNGIGLMGLGSYKLTLGLSGTRSLESGRSLVLLPEVTVHRLSFMQYQLNYAMFGLSLSYGF